MLDAGQELIAQLVVGQVASNRGPESRTLDRLELEPGAPSEFEAELEAELELAAQLLAAGSDPQSVQAGKFSERSEVLAGVGSSSR